VFAFACAVRDEVSGGVRVAGDTGTDDGAHSAGGSAPLPPDVARAMDHWSSTNRDALKNLWTG
jgi:hypothetical protein